MCLLRSALWAGRVSGRGTGCFEPGGFSPADPSASWVGTFNILTAGASGGKLSRVARLKGNPGRRMIGTMVGVGTFTRTGWIVSGDVWGAYGQRQAYLSDYQERESAAADVTGRESNRQQ